MKELYYVYSTKTNKTSSKTRQKTQKVQGLPFSARLLLRWYISLVETCHKFMYFVHKIKRDTIPGYYVVEEVRLSSWKSGNI